MVLLLLVLTTAVVLFSIHFGKRQKKAKQTIQLTTFQTSVGWGYKIEINNKTRIYQPFIPVIETHAGFETKVIAENAGRIVVQKLKRNQQPVLTLKDLQLAGVIIDRKVDQQANSLD
jgi:hypothetical protein